MIMKRNGDSIWTSLFKIDFGPYGCRCKKYVYGYGNGYGCLVQINKDCTDSFDSQTSLFRPRKRFYSSMERKEINLKTKKDYPYHQIPSERDSHIPILAHGLDKVLFNPGVHLLQDPRTGFNNFDPYLKNLIHPDDIDYSLLNEYIPVSQDKKLHTVAQKNNCLLVSSTSSMSPILSLLYFLLGSKQSVNTESFSMGFLGKDASFQSQLKWPLRFILKPHRQENVYSLILEQLQGYSLLAKFGLALEKLFTLDKDVYEKLKKSDTQNYHPGEENYHFTKIGSLLIRAQLDCHDPRLPRSILDIKTRSTVPIRFDSLKLTSKIKTIDSLALFGCENSFERELFDLSRSALMRYNFQTRLGQMDGIFIAFHNTKMIYGFQYLPREEMDRLIFGSTDIADIYYLIVLQILENIAQIAIDQCAQIAENNEIRVTLQLSTSNLPTLKMYTEVISNSQVSLNEQKMESSHLRLYHVSLSHLMNETSGNNPSQFLANECFNTRLLIDRINDDINVSRDYLLLLKELESSKYISGKSKRSLRDTKIRKWLRDGADFMIGKKDNDVDGP